MVMTVACSACAASFPVDPNKIPEGGVKVRCSVCANIFRVERPAPELSAPDPAPPSQPTVEAPAEAHAPEPPTADEAPSHTGHSEGEWEGDPVQVETDPDEAPSELAGGGTAGAGSELASDEEMPDWAAVEEPKSP